MFKFTLDTIILLTNADETIVYISIMQCNGHTLMIAIIFQYEITLFRQIEWKQKKNEKNEHTFATSFVYIESTTSDVNVVVYLIVHACHFRKQIE